MKKYTSSIDEFIGIECRPNSYFDITGGCKIYTNDDTRVCHPLRKGDTIICNKEFEIIFKKEFLNKESEK